MSIKIAIVTSNKQLGLDISRRLTELSGGLDISILGTKERAYINDYDITLDENEFDFMEPVSKLYEEIVCLYHEKTGKTIMKESNSEIKLFSFVSDTGGSGSSALAFTFSRLLSVRKDYKVLYIDCARPSGLFSYCDTNETQSHTSRELEYYLRNNLEYRLINYVVRDRYGPYVITLEKEVSKLISDLDKSSRLNAIVINFGVSSEFQPIGSVIRIYNSFDSRYSIIKDNRNFEIKVINRCENNMIYDDYITVMDDQISFTKNEERIQLAMDRGLTIGVEKLMRKVCADD